MIKIEIKIKTLRDILCKIQADPECDGGEIFSYISFLILSMTGTYKKSEISFKSKLT